MCTIIVLFRTHPSYPVIVAANRDEFVHRATGGLRVLGQSPRVVGGVDLVKGGTWMGVTATGLFVGLTNQRSYAGTDAALLSRGEVVMAALRAGARGAIREYLTGLEPGRYNSFNLIYGDAGGVEIALSRQDAAAIEFRELSPGVIVVSNDGLDTRAFPKVDRARELVTPIAGQPWSSLAPNLQRCLADHDAPHPDRIPDPPEGSVFDRSQLAALQTLCVHMGFYGTRSASIIALKPGGVAHYLHASGPPCESMFEDVTELVHGPASDAVGSKDL